MRSSLACWRCFRAAALRPLYAGGAAGAVATTLASVAGGADRGRPRRLAGAQRARGPARPARGEPPRFRLEVELDDDITGFGIRRDDAVTRERRTLRARYQLVDAGARHGAARRHRRLRRGRRRRLFRICDGGGRADGARAPGGRSRRPDRRPRSRCTRRAHRRAMKVNRPQFGRALRRARRLSLLPVPRPRQSGSRALLRHAAAALGDEVERIDLTGAELKSDPARLADEAARSLCSAARADRGRSAGEESAAGGRRACWRRRRLETRWSRLLARSRKTSRC